MPIRVVNKRSHRPTDHDTYIGRPSKWGNPFVVGRDGTRDEVVLKYAEWLATHPSLMASLHELKDRNLVCWCAPQSCHGDVLKVACEGIQAE